MNSFTFTVHGAPQPAGSKRAFAIRKGGVLTGQVAVTDANPKSKTWKTQVREAAQSAGVVPMDGPIALTIIFRMQRPKGHSTYKGGVIAVRDSAPRYPIVKPDATKLLRCLEDALKGVAWRDDSQVVMQHVQKVYAHPSEGPSAEVTITKWV